MSDKKLLCICFFLWFTFLGDFHYKYVFRKAIVQYENLFSLTSKILGSYVRVLTVVHKQDFVLPSLFAYLVKSLWSSFSQKLLHGLENNNFSFLPKVVFLLTEIHAIPHVRLCSTEKKIVCLTMYFTYKKLIRIFVILTRDFNF